MAEAMITKGKTKYAAKITTMHANYEAAKERAKSNYAAVGFKSSRVEAYRTAWDRYMVTNYKAKVTADKAEKWATNWRAAMFG